MSWVELEMKALLDAATDAIRRARWVFMGINVAGILILGAEFNAMVPWVRYPLHRCNTPVYIHQLLQQFIYNDLYVVTVPLLGIKFSVFDLSVIGSTAMALLATWFFYSVRRENRSLGTLVRRATAALTEDPSLSRYLYYGVAHHFVFTTITESDVPAGQKPRVMPRTAVRILWYMPFWVPLAVIVVDLASIFLPHLMAIDRATTLADQFSVNEWVEVCIRTFYCLALAFFCWKQCRDCARFDTDSRTMLQNLRQRLPECA